MILDAGTLTSFQSCKRQFLLHNDYLPTKWRHKQLFDFALRRCIFSLSNGGDPEKLANDCAAYYMQEAADPGLDLPSGNPYILAKDYSACYQTILRSLAKLALLTVKLVPLVKLDDDTEWRVRSWADDSGTLHRWITIDSWADADLAREIHSWWSAGDQAATGAGMMLHVIEIGQIRRVTKRASASGNGLSTMPEMRRASPWCRGWRNPSIPQIEWLRFRKKHPGGTFQGWEPIYLTDSRIHPDDWVEQMWKDGAAQTLTHHIMINPLPDEARQMTLGHMRSEAKAMRELEGTRWNSLPMSRDACDSWTPCIFQDVCYSPVPVQIESLPNLYQRRQMEAVK